MRLTLGQLRASVNWGNTIGLCPTSDEFTQVLNQALERLMHAPEAQVRNLLDQALPEIAITQMIVPIALTLVKEIRPLARQPCANALKAFVISNFVVR